MSRRLTKILAGGSAGNEQLTAVAGTLVLLLLAVEGATLFNLRVLLGVHAFVGMLLIPPVAIKLASTGWRMARYYLRGQEYLRRGPPHLVLRALLAPVLVSSTVGVFGTGVALLALDRTHGLLLGLHKASFVVWLPALGLHVLTRLYRLLPALRSRLPGTALRAALALGALAAGLALASATLPAADHLQDHVSAQLGLDAR